jgi:hypothetical protein
MKGKRAVLSGKASEEGAACWRGLSPLKCLLTIDNSANFLISLMALGARFLNDTPWTWFFVEILISLPSNIHA